VEIVALLHTLKDELDDKYMCVARILGKSLQLTVLKDMYMESLIHKQSAEKLNLL